VSKIDHPIMKGVSENFRITDELYRFKPDPEGSKINVLARSTNPETGKSFPSVWTVEHGEGRIAVTTLGHDGRAHKHDAYKQILTNAVQWAGGEKPAANADRK
jgi:type 1 glutamine amidotransferase